jgi:hypothetical protein
MVTTASDNPGQARSTLRKVLRLADGLPALPVIDGYNKIQHHPRHGEEVDVF